jgi:hypothetical protein
LCLDGHARAFSVAGRDGGENTPVARGVSTDDGGARVAASPDTVAGAVVSALLGGGLVLAEVVGILAAHDRGAGARGLAGERLCAGIAANAVLVTTNGVCADARGTGVAKGLIRNNLITHCACDWV